MKSFYLVAGLGKTGQSIAGYLKRRNLPFIAFDTRKDVAGLAEFHTAFPGVDVFLENLPTTIYPQLEAIITSPGISLDEPFLRHAVRAGIPVYGDVECLAREITVPVIAITGTNGKSTVTTLVGEMARAAGINVAVAGNIGTPVLDLLDDNNAYDLWVLELSSFQLDLTFSLAPLVATALNISPDHLDRHHSLDVYINAKQRVYTNAKIVLYNRDDEATFPTLALATHQHAANFGLTAPQSERMGADQWGIVHQEGAYYLAHGEDCWLSTDALRIKGKHNWQNALAACALATAAGISRAVIVEVLKTFAGLPHRCQWVRTLDGVDWINDSKGTNIGAAQSAICGIGGSISGKIVLIAGGQGKGADFTELRAPVKDYVRAVVLIGQDAENIASALTGVVPISRAATLKDALVAARREAQAGDVVLLSPACASFDMFRDFNHRGEMFTALVNGL